MMDMVLEIVDMILFPIAEPLKVIVEAILKILELVITLATAIPEILMAAIQIFDPVAVLNDIIAGTFLGIKLIFKSVADIFTSGPNFKYNKCKDAGEGIFGFRRNRDEIPEPSNPTPPYNLGLAIKWLSRRVFRRKEPQIGNPAAGFGLS